MQRVHKKARLRGSITVEACITLPVFLSVFFLLLFLVKFTCTGMLLDYAVNETAKEIAAAAYPISFINELEDEKIGEYGNARIPTLQEELDKLGKQIDGGFGDSVLDIIKSSDYNGAEAAALLKGLLEDYGRGIIGEMIDCITPAYWDMKSSGKYMIANHLIKEHLDNPLINKGNVRLRLVEFPQGKEEYNERSRNKDAYESFGLTPGSDFDMNDVVIQLEYGYKVKLPFVKALDIKMVHTAVERAWVNGSFGILTVEDEGLELGTSENIVFVTRTGIRYHKGSCWHLRRSRIPMDIAEARGKGYTPCKVCKPQN